VQSRAGSFRRWELAPAAGLAVVGGWVAGFAATRPGTYDLGLAYLGGAEAWASGRPERVFTWISTPFLAMLMAVATRVASAGTLAVAFNVFNVALAIALIAATWWGLRGRLPVRLWWLTLFAAVLFAPLSSTLWWKQLNLLALALAVAGFALLRRDRKADPWAAALIALSISIKPIVILLPLVLLLRADSRRAGLYLVGWTALLEAVAQAFLAWRAHDLAVLSPLPALTNFTAKSLPAANGWACNVQDFSPTSTVCRLTGGPFFWDLQRLAVLAFVLGLAWLLWRALRGFDARTWEMFAAACLLSPMLSPLAWSHYQLLLGPMFVVLVVRLPRTPEALPRWLLLGGAFLLAEISWTPIGTIADLAGLGSLAPPGSRAYGSLLTAAAFAQYFLLTAAILALAPARPVPSRHPGRLLVENAGR
jgi:hypothetical protein